MLIAIVKKELKLEASLYTFLQILSVSIFEKTWISCALQPIPHRTDQAPFVHRLNLFGIQPVISNILAACRNCGRNRKLNHGNVFEGLFLLDEEDSVFRFGIVVLCL